MSPESNPSAALLNNDTFFSVDVVVVASDSGSSA